MEASDLEGTFIVGEAAAVLGPGAGAQSMKNSKGVVLKLKSTQKGARLALAGEGMKVSLK